MSKCYIEIVGEITVWGINLTLWDRFRIGKFTRENVLTWLEKRHHPLDQGFSPVDFHAVCGDIDIPWATKEGRECYTAHIANRPYTPSWLEKPEIGMCATPLHTVDDHPRYSNCIDFIAKKKTTQGGP